MTTKPDLTEKLRLLEAKFSAMGQDLNSYLDGLLHADYLTYWDYIHLDTLLSLQNPRTPFPDEEIFIMYHQITELYFKLSLHELQQISEKKELDATFILARAQRVNNYFKALIGSFEIMITGMEKDQFLKFRMSLLPASGFQSAQYRTIELYSTAFEHLVHSDKRASLTGAESVEEMFNLIYWKTGATELATGKKTLTLRQFEDKYEAGLISLAKNNKGKTLFDKYKQLPESDLKLNLKEELRQLDLAVNVHWPLMHYKSAVRYLQKSPEDIAATGGTNWQKYLPPRFQKRIFYPALWNEHEIEEWGKSWVEAILS